MHSGIGGCRTRRGAAVLDELINNAIVAKESGDCDWIIAVGIQSVYVGM